jgi:uncharacterized protein DUF4154
MRFLRSAVATIVIVTTGAALGATGPNAGPEVQRADEYRVKAAMLFNFTRFIEWPPEVFSSPATPLTVCVLGVDPFGGILEDALKGHSAGGRSIQIKRIGDVEAGCHVVFISGSERKRFSVLADRLRTTGALTISEEEGFGTVGGMIELFTDGESVKFNIYTGALEQSRLRASARLIALAANQKHGGRR